MSSKEINIGFIGAGSIGTLFGGYLAMCKSNSYSIKVILFGREEHVKAINNNGLILKKDDITFKVNANLLAFENIDEFNKYFIEFDFIFLTTKSYDIISAITQYKKIIEKSKYIVILQNGIGNEEIVRKYFHEEKIIRCVTTNGALVEIPGIVIHTGLGYTKIGSPFNKSGQSIDHLKDLNGFLNKSGLQTEISNNIIKDCWEKIFVNIGINAIGALTRLRNGELVKNEGLKSLMAGAIKEALLVADKKEIVLSKKDYVNLTYEVAKNTYQNKNSMLQDILKAKKTEIDFINGKIVDYAKELDIETPINTVLTLLIKGLEK